MRRVLYFKISRFELLAVVCVYNILFKLNLNYSTSSSGPGSSVGIINYGLHEPGIESWYVRDFQHLSTQALGNSQPPVQQVKGLPGGKERPGREVEHPPPSSAVVEKE